MKQVHSPYMNINAEREREGERGREKEGEGEGEGERDKREVTDLSRPFFDPFLSLAEVLLQIKSTSSENFLQ